MRVKFNTTWSHRFLSYAFGLATIILVESCAHDREIAEVVNVVPANGDLVIDNDIRIIADSMLVLLQDMQLSIGLLETSPNSNLVSLYDNALAALVFIENADYAKAESIFSYFDARIQTELLSGNGEVLAPTFIEWKANEDKASFIVVNISAHPIQPVMADLQEGLSAAGLREIPALNEITVTLSRTKGEITTHIEGYRINVVSKGKSQVEIKLDPLEK